MNHCFNFFFTLNFRSFDGSISSSGQTSSQGFDPGSQSQGSGTHDQGQESSSGTFIPWSGQDFRPESGQVLIPGSSQESNQEFGHDSHMELGIDDEFIDPEYKPGSGQGSNVGFNPGSDQTTGQGIKPGFGVA